MSKKIRADKNPDIGQDNSEPAGVICHHLFWIIYSESFLPEDLESGECILSINAHTHGVLKSIECIFNGVKCYILASGQNQYPTIFQKSRGCKPISKNQQTTQAKQVTALLIFK